MKIAAVCQPVHPIICPIHNVARTSLQLHASNLLFIVFVTLVSQYLLAHSADYIGVDVQTADKLLQWWAHARSSGIQARGDNGAAGVFFLDRHFDRQMPESLKSA